jgi:hypothetical protein
VKHCLLEHAPMRRIILPSSGYTTDAASLRNFSNLYGAVCTHVKHLVREYHITLFTALRSENAKGAKLGACPR